MDAIDRVRRLPHISSAADAKQGSEIRCGKIYTETLDSLLQNKELETLVIDSRHDVYSLESCRALRELVRTSTTLKHLSLSNVNMVWGGLRVIVEGILSNSQSAVEALDLGSNWELSITSWGEVNSSERRVNSLESWRALGKLVRTSTTLKHLSLRVMGMNGEDLKLIVEGILSNSQSALEALDLGGNEKLALSFGEGREQSTDRVNLWESWTADRVNLWESWTALGKLVQTSTTLKHLSLMRTGMKGEHLKHIVKGIQKNSQAGLETLDLSCNEELGCAKIMVDYDTYIGEGAKQLTDLLLGNTRALATLDISVIKFSAGEMRSIGKGLASNATLINFTLGCHLNGGSWYLRINLPQHKEC